MIENITNSKNQREFYFTSESVTEGHPDKVCDCISDAVLDAILDLDSEARVACETMASSEKIILSGEISTTHDLDKNFYIDFHMPRPYNKYKDIIDEIFERTTFKPWNIF